MTTGSSATAPDLRSRLRGCLLAGAVGDVGRVLADLGAEILQGPREYDAEPDRYAVFFLDPDGIKLEVIHAR